eukprot:13847455-Ditylum_brightwellii.AAC.1
MPSISNNNAVSSPVKFTCSKSYPTITKTNGLDLECEENQMWKGRTCIVAPKKEIQQMILEQETPPNDDTMDIDNEAEYMEVGTSSDVEGTKEKAEKAEKAKSKHKEKT